jgi:hypothetical protein
VPGSVAAKIHAHAEDAAAQPQPKDIKREANERKNAAIKARIDAHKTAAVEGAGVAESADPKEKTPPAAAASVPSKEPAKPAGAKDASASSEESSATTTAEETPAEKAERERRYDVKNIRD